MVMSGKSVRKELRSLVENLQWTWHPELWSIFRDLDPQLWRETNHNPLALLERLDDATLEARVQASALKVRLPSLIQLQKDYIESRPPLDGYVGPLLARPVAYFSAEFGIHESLPLYSGGLGILAGDHLKSASDVGVPLVAVGLFYGTGYFKQRVEADGWQYDDYPRTDTSTLPIELVEKDGAPLVIAIETDGGTLKARVWRLMVGRTRLFLMDTDIPENTNEEHRQLTRSLYGGDVRTRIRQELLLGVGGMRALKAMGINPGVVHLNEGHSAFAPLELIRQLMADNGATFANALRDVAIRTVFTTHTPVEAGHDRFTPDLVEAHLRPLREALGLSHQALINLGRVRDDSDELFCMTVLAFKTSRRANAVSAIHGHVSRAMWRQAWPNMLESDIPIGHITNGIHVPSFLAPAMASVFDRHFDTGWRRRISDPAVWAQVDGIEQSALWETHNLLKGQMIRYLRRRIYNQRVRWGEAPEAVKNETSHLFDPDALTIGFARRFAQYKRANLLLRDLDRLDRLVNNPDKPVQFLFAGKAHPKDHGGKMLLQTVARLRNDPRFANRIFVIEDYDMGVARHLVQGVDVWLNNPRRPNEACGTSGMKGILNGVLHCSILDGWWAEAYDGANGFAIGDGTIHENPDILDARDYESMMHTLENEVVPMYYDRGSDDIPVVWVERVKRAIRTLAWRFTADRMVRDYVRYAYLPALGAVQAASTDRLSQAALGGPAARRS